MDNTELESKLQNGVASLFHAERKGNNGGFAKRFHLGKLCRWVTGFESRATAEGSQGCSEQREQTNPWSPSDAPNQGFVSQNRHRNPGYNSKHLAPRGTGKGIKRKEPPVTPEALLELVHDRDSFVVFVEALANEREKAELLERSEPVRYQLGGALNWQNGDISNFLFAALNCFEHPDNCSSAEPSWRIFAEFLYFGKIYE